MLLRTLTSVTDDFWPLTVIFPFLIQNYNREFTPKEVSEEIGVTNKTIINRLAVLSL